MSHSPEPWATETRHASDGQPWNAILDANGKLVVEPWDRVYESGCYSLSNQDAQRITAAVNFCQHLPTDFLSKYSAHLCDGFGSLADIPHFYGLIPVSKKILDSTPPTS